MVKVFYAYKSKDFSKQMLKFLLLKHYGIDIKDSDVISSPYGKLYLVNNKIFFNITHSKDIIAIAFSNEEVGVDIEKIRDKDLTKLSEKFFGNKPKTNEEFFTLWTVAESFVKYKASSIVTDLKNIEILDNKLLYNNELQDVVFKSIIFDGNVLTVTQKSDFDIELIPTDF